MEQRINNQFPMLICYVPDSPGQHVFKLK